MMGDGILALVEQSALFYPIPHFQSVFPSLISLFLLSMLVQGWAWGQNLLKSSAQPIFLLVAPIIFNSFII